MLIFVRMVSFKVIFKGTASSQGLSLWPNTGENLEIILYLV